MFLLGQELLEKYKPWQLRVCAGRGGRERRGEGEVCIRECNVLSTSNETPSLSPLFPSAHTSKMLPSMDLRYSVAKEHA